MSRKTPTEKVLTIMEMRRKLKLHPLAVLGHDFRLAWSRKPGWVLYTEDGQEETPVYLSLASGLKLYHKFGQNSGLKLT
jgi:hypothetical protein